MYAGIIGFRKDLGGFRCIYAGFVGFRGGLVVFNVCTLVSSGFVRV